MKPSPIQLRPGYTLVEMALAICIGMIVAAMVLGLANQQFAFLRIYTAQSFLIEEAPVINSYLNRIVGQAERYRLHNSLTEGKNGTNAVLTNATTLTLTYHQPDGTSKSGILCFQDLGSGNALYYYTVPANGTLETPEWALTKRPQDVRFSIENGILRTRITGPNGEVVTYSGTMQQ